MPRTRPISRSPGRSTSSASRPTRFTSSRPTTGSACAGRPWPQAIAAGPGARPAAVRHRGGRGLDEHRLDRPARRAGRPGRARGALAPRRRGLRRGRPAVGPGRRPGAGASSGPTRSRSIPTSGSSRPTTSARSSSAGAATCSRPSIAAPEYYRGGEAEADARPRRATATRLERAAQLLPALDGGHPSLPGAQAVAQLEAPRDGAAWAGWSRRTTTWPPTSPGRSPQSDDFEALPEAPELSVVCFRHLPGGTPSGRALDPAAPRRPPGSPAGGPRGIRRRLAVDDPAARPRPTCAPGSSIS